MHATIDLRLSTVAELRAKAADMNVRLMADRNDTAADYALNRIDAELRRRQRLCRAPHGDTICHLLDGHGGDHHSLLGVRW